MSFRFGGLRIKDLTTRSQSSASVAYVEVAPGVAHATAKSTRSDKYYVCIAGRVVFEVNEQRVELAPLDLLVHVPPFDPEGEVFQE